MIYINGQPVFNQEALEEQLKLAIQIENAAIAFGVWYSGMERKKVEAAYKRYLKEKFCGKNN